VLGTITRTTPQYEREYPKGFKDGEYTVSSPYYDPDIWDGKPVPNSWPKVLFRWYSESNGWSDWHVHSGKESHIYYGGFSGGSEAKGFLSENFSRMVGSAHYTDEHDHWVAQWDLRRVATSPPPPKLDNPEEEEDDEEDCEHYRKQMEEYQSIQANNTQQIRHLADEIRKAKDRLIDLGWTEKDGDVNPLASLFWRGNQWWVTYISKRKYSPDFKLPVSFSDAEKAAFNKLRKLRHTQNEYARSQYEAQMNEAYYRQAAADCERDRDNPKDSKAPPKPRPDTRFLDKKGGF